MKILLIEDDPAIRRLIRRILARRSFEVLQAANAADGLDLARALRPDLILSDWVLGSGPHGVDLCADLKGFICTRSIPIIVITGAKVEFDDELAALSSGADLYLTKDAVLGSPAQSARFFKYIKCLLDRPFAASESDRPASTASGPGLRLDLGNHTVAVEKEIVSNLSTKLFDLLYVLAQNHPGIVSRRHLVKYIWKNTVQDREVDVAVCRLKARIEKNGETLIESVVGKGYRLKCAPSIRTI